MSSNNSSEMMGVSRRFLICLLGLLSLFANFASAQYVHQLLYNNYNWTDRSLAGQQMNVGENSISAFTRHRITSCTFTTSARTRMFTSARSPRNLEDLSVCRFG